MKNLNISQHLKLILEIIKKNKNLNNKFKIKKSDFVQNKRYFKNCLKKIKNYF